MFRKDDPTINTLRAGVMGAKRGWHAGNQIVDITKDGTKTTGRKVAEGAAVATGSLLGTMFKALTKRY